MMKVIETEAEVLDQASPEARAAIEEARAHRVQVLAHRRQAHELMRSVDAALDHVRTTLASMGLRCNSNGELPWRAVDARLQHVRR